MTASGPTVMVTAVGGGGVGYQVLSALQLVGERYRLVAADASAYSVGLFGAERRYLLPFARDAEYLEALLRLARREHVDVLIPGSEPEVVVVSGQAEALMAAGVHPIVSPLGVVQLCADKTALADWLAGHGFDTPRTATGAAWRVLAESCGFPLVGKPIRASGGSRNVAILANEAEVADYLARMGQLGVDVLFQEYVGDPDHEFTVGVLVASDGDVIDSIVLRRRLVGLSRGASRVVGGRDVVLSTGISQGYVVRDEAVSAVCERLAAEIGARGPLNVQGRWRDGQFCVFEVHPRFSGTTSIRADVGFNEPDVLVRDVLYGERFGRLSYRTDVAVMRALRNIVVPVGDLQRIVRA